MSEQSDAAMYKIFSKVKETHDRVPRGITEVLELISDPAVIDLTWAWLEECYTDIDAADQDEFEQNDISSGLGGYYG